MKIVILRRNFLHILAHAANPLIGPRLAVLVLLLAWVRGSAAAEPAAPTARWWPDTVESALTQAGTNRQELAQALERTPPAQRDGIQFLLENMPGRDLRTLSAEFLLENLALAHSALQETPWAKRISAELFLNDILPYANLTEPRDNWRKRLCEICRPLVQDCKTPVEAAQRLNQELFKLLKVRYSTQRRATDQGPLETMASGVATCTGLSILLVDACRAVGVPARIAGTPLWVNNSGNHTWVEIWDGDWHFLGAAEPDPNGLDRGWFVGNASQALKDDRRHAIYAGSFRKTGLSFPLSWARSVDYVSAVNVTERYTAKSKPAEASRTRLLVNVFDRPVGQRVAAQVTVTDAADPVVRLAGTSKDNSADLNDHVTFDLPRQHTYVIEAERAGQTRRQYFTTGTNAEELLAVFLGGIPPVPAVPPTGYAPPPINHPLSSPDEAELKQALAAFFTAPADRQAQWEFPGNLEKLLRDNEPAVRQIAWECFRAAPIHEALQQDFDAHRVRFAEHLSPYTVKTVGARPTNGWALFIAMHGGGGAPQELNDSQWRAMQRYYRDHPEVGGYRYLALRAPNNTWNGFYTGYVYPLIANLVRQCLLFGDVAPNKVFLMGYSHGGYGAFAIGPKMPDHFAAIHASAAAPADGAVPETLRNTFFTCMVGGKDTMYGRLDRCRSFDEAIRQLRGDRTDIYPVSVQFIADHPHSGLPDRDKIAEMYPAVRNPVPRELTWLMTDDVIRDFFWLQVPVPGQGKRIEAACRGNRLTVTATTNLTAASVLLDRRLIDFEKPVELELNGQTRTVTLQPSLRTLCDTLQRRGDPELAFTAEIALPLALPAPAKPASAAPTRLPNIVLILADDLGYGDVSCYNPQSKIQTPNLDRLAAQGMRFTDAHTPSGVCSPTRYGVLTGRYSWRSSLKSGVLDGYSKPLIPPTRETLASLLKKQGYRTAAVGKWHLGLDFTTTDNRPLQGNAGNPPNLNWSGPINHGPLALGFDYYFGCAASWDMPPYAWIENDRLAHPEVVPTDKGDRFGRAGVKSPGMKPEDALPALKQSALAFIAAAATQHRDHPFFLYFPLTAPHTPVAPNPEFHGKSQAGSYGDFVVEVDALVGQVLQALQTAGVADHTLVIFTSDNGPENPMEKRKLEYQHFSASHFLGHKRDNWEGGHRVPFIARWPGEIPAGATSDEIICLTDLMATYAAVAGCPLPADAGPDSYNLLPALRGTKLNAPIREATVHHSSGGNFAIRQGQWKLLLHPGSGGNNYQGQPGYAAYYEKPVQLYDLAADPDETKNLTEANPEVVARLTALMQRYIVEGRSTPGPAQTNDTPNNWKQLDWMPGRQAR